MDRIPTVELDAMIEAILAAMDAGTLQIDRLSIAELLVLSDYLVEEAKSVMLEREERWALAAPPITETTRVYAIQALGRAERYPGEHQVARAYLDSLGSTGGRFHRPDR